MKSLILMVAIVATSVASYGRCETSHAKLVPNAKTFASKMPDNQRLTTVITHYLQLKNALAADNSKAAAVAAKALHKALIFLKKANESADIYDASINNADHMGQSGDNINQQRAYFQVLSEGVYQLVKRFGVGQTLYKDYCPMARVSWLSEVKDINNPYFGPAMRTCGEVKETIK